ncbi:MAG: HEAT repeat domain-containing protein [Deferrisomatales bacterium]|nr:HEAT repeat domain-containing protein [Deferrisomatales bacterium]
MEADRLGSKSDSEPLSGPLEAFSRDLLALVRAVRVYPPGHPFLLGLASRLTAMVGTSLPGPLLLGVTARELVSGPHFAGGPGSRAAELAARLHGRRVLRLTWAQGAEPEEAVRLAEVLGARGLSGDGLTAALRQRGVSAMDLEPLELHRIHDSFREGKAADAREAGGRQAWQWLLKGAASPEQIAGFLTSDAFWEASSEGDPDGAEAPRPGQVLFRLGERLSAALEHLPPGQRDKVLDRLARVGRELSPRDLAGILGAAEATGILEGPVSGVLEDSFQGERLVDLLAALVDREGRNTRRLAEVYGRLAQGQAGELLSVVDARLASPGKTGFTAEVWETVEHFLLDAQEGAFMGDEYSSSLESLAGVPGEAEATEEPGVADDPERHLDRVVLGLALDDPDRWVPRFLDRVDVRAQTLAPRALLGLLGELDAESPDLLETRPALLDRLLRSLLRHLRRLGPGDREALLAFGRRHERVLLDTALRILGEEESIAGRRFLVELLSAFSPAATPSLVSRVRSAPWYVSRNLAIALGRKGEEAVVPVLRSLLGHDHPKVRREAILALGTLATEAAWAALREAAGSGGRLAEERALAKRVLQRASTEEGGR